MVVEVLQVSVMTSPYELIHRDGEVFSLGRALQLLLRIHCHLFNYKITMGSCVTAPRNKPSEGVRSHVPSTVISSSKFDLKFAEELQRATEDIENLNLDFRVRVHNFRGRLPFVVSY